MTYQEPMHYQPREGKLPIWAQEIIRGLRMKLSDAEAAAQMALMATKPEDSVVIIERMDRSHVGLGSETITFKLGDHWTRSINARVENGPEGRRLVIRGNTGITIKPSAANSIEIFSDRR